MSMRFLISALNMKSHLLMLNEYMIPYLLVTNEYQILYFSVLNEYEILDHSVISEYVMPNLSMINDHVISYLSVHKYDSPYLSHTVTYLWSPDYSKCSCFKVPKLGGIDTKCDESLQLLEDVWVCGLHGVWATLNSLG